MNKTIPSLKTLQPLLMLKDYAIRIDKHAINIDYARPT